MAAVNVQQNTLMFNFLGLAIPLIITHLVTVGLCFGMAVLSPDTKYWVMCGMFFGGLLTVVFHACLICEYMRTSYGPVQLEHKFELPPNHKVVVHNFGWKRDLTKEGIEPNPGPVGLGDLLIQYPVLVALMLHMVTYGVHPVIAHLNKEIRQAYLAVRSERSFDRLCIDFPTVNIDVDRGYMQLTYYRPYTIFKMWAGPMNWDFRQEVDGSLAYLESLRSNIGSFIATVGHDQPSCANCGYRECSVLSNTPLPRVAINYSEDVMAEIFEPKNTDVERRFACLQCVRVDRRKMWNVFLEILRNYLYPWYEKVEHPVHSVFKASRLLMNYDYSFFGQALGLASPEVYEMFMYASGGPCVLSSILMPLNHEEHVISVDDDGVVIESGEMTLYSTMIEMGTRAKYGVNRNFYDYLNFSDEHYEERTYLDLKELARTIMMTSRDENDELLWDAMWKPLLFAPPIQLGKGNDILPLRTMFFRNHCRDAHMFFDTYYIAPTISSVVLQIFAYCFRLGFLPVLRQYSSAQMLHCKELKLSVVGSKMFSIIIDEERFSSYCLKYHNLSGAKKDDMTAMEWDQFLPSSDFMSWFRPIFSRATEHLVDYDTEPNPVITIEMCEWLGEFLEGIDKQVTLAYSVVAEMSGCVAYQGVVNLRHMYYKRGRRQFRTQTVTRKWLISYDGWMFPDMATHRLSSYINGVFKATDFINTSFSGGSYLGPYAEDEVFYFKRGMIYAGDQVPQCVLVEVWSDGKKYHMMAHPNNTVGQVAKIALAGSQRLNLTPHVTHSGKVGYLCHGKLYHAMDFISNLVRGISHRLTIRVVLIPDTMLCKGIFHRHEKELFHGYDEPSSWTKFDDLDYELMFSWVSDVNWPRDAEGETISAWVKDLTTEGVEPNPGPGMYHALMLRDPELVKKYIGSQGWMEDVDLWLSRRPSQIARVFCFCPGSGKTYLSERYHEVYDYESDFPFNVFLGLVADVVLRRFVITLVHYSPKRFILTNLHHLVPWEVHFVIAEMNFKKNIAHRAQREQLIQWYIESYKYSHMVYAVESVFGVQPSILGHDDPFEIPARTEIALQEITLELHSRQMEYLYRKLQSAIVGGKFDRVTFFSQRAAAIMHWLIRMGSGDSKLWAQNVHEYEEKIVDDLEARGSDTYSYSYKERFKEVNAPIFSVYGDVLRKDGADVGYNESASYLHSDHWKEDTPSAEVQNGGEWVKDLTTEGIEPNPGPATVQVRTLIDLSNILKTILKTLPLNRTKLVVHLCALKETTAKVMVEAKQWLRNCVLSKEQCDELLKINAQVRVLAGHAENKVAEFRTDVSGIADAQINDTVSDLIQQLDLMIEKIRADEELETMVDLLFSNLPPSDVKYDEEPSVEKEKFSRLENVLMRKDKEYVHDATKSIETSTIVTDLTHYFQYRVSEAVNGSGGVLRKFFQYEELDPKCFSFVVNTCVYTAINQLSYFADLKGMTDRESYVQLAKVWTAYKHQGISLNDLFTLDGESISFYVSSCELSPLRHEHYHWHNMKDSVQEQCSVAANTVMTNLQIKDGYLLRAYTFDFAQLQYRVLAWEIGEGRISKPKALATIDEIEKMCSNFGVDSCTLNLRHVKVEVAKSYAGNGSKFGRERLVRNQDEVVARLHAAWLEHNPEDDDIPISIVENMFRLAKNKENFQEIVLAYPDYRKMSSLPGGEAILRIMADVEAKYASGNKSWMSDISDFIKSKVFSMPVDQKEFYMEQRDVMKIPKVELRLNDVAGTITFLSKKVESHFSIVSTDPWHDSFRLQDTDILKILEVAIVGVGSAAVGAIVGYASATRGKRITKDLIDNTLTTVAASLGLIEPSMKTVLMFVPILVGQFARVSEAYDKYSPKGAFESDAEQLPPMNFEDLQLDDVLKQFQTMEFGASLYEAVTFLKQGMVVTDNVKEHSPWNKLRIDQMKPEGKMTEENKRIWEQNVVKKIYVANKVVEFVSKYPVKKETLSEIRRALEHLASEKCSPAELRPYVLYLLYQLEKASHPSLLGILKEHGALKGLKQIIAMHPVPSACLASVAVTVAASLIGFLVGKVQSIIKDGGFESRYMPNARTPKIMGAMKREYFISDPSAYIVMVDGERGKLKPGQYVVGAKGQVRKTKNGWLLDADRDWEVTILRDGEKVVVDLPFASVNDAMKNAEATPEELDLVNKLKAGTQYLNPADMTGVALREDYYNLRKEQMGLHESTVCQACHRIVSLCHCRAQDLGRDRAAVITSYSDYPDLSKIHKGVNESNDSEKIAATPKYQVASRQVRSDAKPINLGSHEAVPKPKDAKIIWFENLPDDGSGEEFMLIKVPIIPDDIKKKYGLIVDARNFGRFESINPKNKELIKKFLQGSGIALGALLVGFSVGFIIVRKYHGEALLHFGDLVNVPITFPELYEYDSVKATATGQHEMMMGTPVFQFKHVGSDAQVSVQDEHGTHISWGLVTDRGLCINKHTWKHLKLENERKGGSILLQPYGVANRVELITDDIKHPDFYSADPDGDAVMLRASIPFVQNRFTLSDFAGPEDASKITEGTPVAIVTPVRGTRDSRLRTSYGQVHLRNNILVHTNGTDGSAIVDYDCSTLKGDCGSPVYLESGKIAGIHFWGCKSNNGFLPSWGSFRKWYISLKNWDVAKCGAPNI